MSPDPAGSPHPQVGPDVEPTAVLRTAGAGTDRTVLVTGGAGYIGGHVVAALRAVGHPVLVVDDLSTGVAARLPDVPLHRLDLADVARVGELTTVLRDAGVRSVLHLAARKKVDESVARPLWYAEQNVGGLTHLLAAMVDAGVDELVFSSSAAVYGSTGPEPVDESAPTAPVNPYGRTKLVGEWLLADAARAHGLRTVALRYFNVAGTASPDLADLGTGNLVTATVQALRAGRRPRVFGTDYPTPDGTCVRDFVHVQDVAEAHLTALDAVRAAAPGTAQVFNVGTGHGASVAAVVRRLAELAGRPDAGLQAPRRPGDPPSVLADVGRIRERYGWRARLDLEEMLRSAWQASTPTG